MSDIFQLVNWINDKSHYPSEEELKMYQGYVINRIFSKYPDTVLFANEMNKASKVPPSVQFDFFFYGVSKRKRWGAKKEVEDTEKIELIKKAFKYSTHVARETVDLIDELNAWGLIKESLEQGGIVKGRKK